MNIKILVCLRYFRIRKDGSEKKIRPPKNYPGFIEAIVGPEQEIDSIVTGAVKNYLHERKLRPHRSLQCEFSVIGYGDPACN